MMITQNEMIIQYIKDYGSITPLEALQEFGCMRLASRIRELKEKGYEINSCIIKSKNRYGKNMHYSKYFLKERESTNAE